MSQSVAFKCTYNDGDEGIFVGFSGTCTNTNIQHNVTTGRFWCSNSSCECKNFLDRGMTGRRPSEPCLESTLFTDWAFGAGGYHGEIRSGAMHLANSGPGKFAILTTRFPGEAEEDRRIIGLFKIARIEDQNRVYAVRRAGSRIRLPLEEAKSLFYWAYANTKKNTPLWGSGLFRYLDDGQVHRILADVVETVRDERTKAAIRALIKDSFDGLSAPLASGCRPQKSTGRLAVIDLLRKYGPGGEGIAHRELKERIAKHPNLIGLHDVSDVKVEYRFISGDLVDLLFEHKSGAYTVVEVETTDVLPGAHQAVKYRALLCAQKGFPLDSTRVKSIVAAWSTTSSVRDFCSTYGIEWREVPPKKT